jgi:hypothetical protein
VSQFNPITPVSLWAVSMQYNPGMCVPDSPDASHSLHANLGASALGTFAAGW